MHLTEEQFVTLERLSALRLSEEEKQVMIDKMDGVINLLNKIGDLDTGVTDQWVEIPVTEGMYVHEGVEDFGDTDALLANVQHEVSGKAIVVKSFVVS